MNNRFIMDQNYAIMVNILSRLPIKSLIRFKSVSKSWNSIISGADLAAAHLQRTKTNSSTSDRRQFLIPGGALDHLCGRYLLDLQNWTLRSSSFLQIPEEIGPDHYELCYCDGLIVACGKDTLNTLYVVWNPSTRTYVKIKCPYRFRRWHPIMPVHGFCYDWFTNDYKLVVTDMKFYAVFHCRQWGWSELKKVPELGLDIKLGASSQVASCNGNLYWLFYDIQQYTYGEQVSYCEVVCFDLSLEKFRKLPEPLWEAASRVRFASGGSNLYLCRQLNRAVRVERTEQLLLLKSDGSKDSWVEIDIGAESLSSWLTRLGHILCVVSDDEFVVSDDEDKWERSFFIYNKRKDSFTNIFKHLAVWRGQLDFLPFIENMFFSSEDNGGREGVCHY